MIGQNDHFPTDVLEYALDDIKYLIPIYKKLLEELIKDNKQAWAEEEAQFLLDKDTYNPNYQANNKED